MSNKITNITLTEDQQRFVIENYQQMEVVKMASRLNISYSKLLHNMELMGIKSPFNRKRGSLVKEIDFENGYWNDNVHKALYGTW